jgi:hypothetical protein
MTDLTLMDANGLIRNIVVGNSPALFAQNYTVLSRAASDFINTYLPNSPKLGRHANITNPQGNWSVERNGSSPTLLQTEVGPNVNSTTFNSLACFKLTLNSTDAQTNSGLRTEISLLNSKIGYNEPVSIKYTHWFDPGTSVIDQAILQVHTTAYALGMSPCLLIIAGGTDYEVQLRYNTNAIPSEGTNTVVVLWSGTITPAWTTWDIEINLEPRNASTGYCRISLNGTQIVNYTGRIGYYDTTAFVKAGIYHWLAWGGEVTPREIYIHKLDVTIPPRGQLIPI